MRLFRDLAAPVARWMAASAAALVLAACGGGSSDPAPAAAPEVKLVFSAAQVNAGDNVTLTWSSTNASSCTASGSWSGSQPTSGSLSFVPSAAGAFSYHLDCTGSGGTAGADARLAVVTAAAPVPPVSTPAGAGSNVMAVTVDRGPTGTSFNMPFVSVTVCSPGTSTCRTVDRILVDTGSTGLRIMASALGGPATDFPQVVNSASQPVAQCAQFASGYAWGSVRRADVRLGGETASRLPIQVIGDTTSPLATTPVSCSNTGANLGTVALLGANGILGVSMHVQDCGTACLASSAPRVYYGCTSTGCASTSLPLESQLTNPVTAFATDNNGLALTLPPVPIGGASTLSGTLTFGIGTQANNALGAQNVYPTNNRGEFTTIYKGVSYTSSFIDSGSNGVFFDDSSLPVCGQFYCPPTPLSLTATNVSPNGASATVNFTLDNARTLTAGIAAHNVGGTLGLSGTFDWGLPFFFGRTVFVAINGAQTPKGVGPYWAY